MTHNIVVEPAQMDKGTVKTIYKPHFHLKQKVIRWRPDIILLYYVFFSVY